MEPLEQVAVLMTSLAATLANALSGLNVAQRALSVTANNVANANTEG
jgi:flagellar hook-associated protein FlgK